MPAESAPFSLGAFQQFNSLPFCRRGVYCYHAHTYFPQTSDGMAAAQNFRHRLQEDFKDDSAVMFGAIQNYARGTHPLGNFKTVFTRSLYGPVLMWLQSHRPHGLSILIHPVTLNFVADHTANALWLGQVLALNIDNLWPQQARNQQRMAAGELETKLIWEAASDIKAKPKPVNSEPA